MRKKTVMTTRHEPVIKFWGSPVAGGSTENTDANIGQSYRQASSGERHTWFGWVRKAIYVIVVAIVLRA